MFQVKKNDGRMVPFEANKITVVLTRVGLTPAEAQNIAREVENWASSQPNQVVSTAQIKQKILGLVSPEAAQKIKMFVKQRRANRQV